METIQNDSLKVLIDEKGAELKSVMHLDHQLEYMWSGDPAFWGKTSPVLFPIVGTLKENTYLYEGKAYQLPRHGFARERVFSVTQRNPQSVRFSLSDDDTTKQVYPFEFSFSIIYTVEEDRLDVAYEVQNNGNAEMYFSVGGHPAFRLPLAEGTEYNDYRLEFEKKETAGRWPISNGGLIETIPVSFIQNENELQLSKDLFKKDAIVLKHLQSNQVRLVSDKTPHGLQFNFQGFPYLGLWAAPNADFICIEPWCGIADSVETQQNITEKEGIISLPAGEKFNLQWQVRFF